jgi:hypothetical protein
MESVTISGVYLGTTAVESLKNKAKSRSVLTIQGVPGIDTATYFIIVDMQQSPIKPGVAFPGETPGSPPVKHAYTISLQKVSDF